MRLTLRTLLAYLDNTLEEKDAQALRQKIAESGFATQLIQKIRASLANQNMTAPSPDSVHPIAEPNVISEYLDSTLTGEQCAEIERACLEVEPHLAEAAACHQILTMVLGQPASISDDLRQKIYLMPDQAHDKSASNDISSITIPSEEAIDIDAPVESATTAVPDTKPVPPLGRDDSGVSDAPSRIRELESAKKKPAVAGRRSDRLAVSDVYDGQVRTSRLTPWLVSLGLAGVLLFALGKIFWEPLFGGKKTANQDEIVGLGRYGIEDGVPLNLPEDDVMSAGDKKTTAPASTNTTPPATNDTPAPAVNASEPAEPLVTPEVVELPAPEPVAAPAPDPAPDPVADPVADPDMVMQTDPASPTIVASPDVPPSVPAPAESPDKKADMMPAPAADPPLPTAVAAPAPSVDSKVDPGPPAAKPMMADKEAAATSLGEKTLLVAHQASNGNWNRLKKDASIPAGTRLVNAPGFRSPIDPVAGPGVTLVGASEVVFGTPGAGPMVDVKYGRGVLTAKTAGDVATLVLPETKMKIKFAAKGDQLGYELRYSRQPGFDPQQPENHSTLARVFSASGEVDLEIAGKMMTLKPNDCLILRGAKAPEPVTLPQPLAWVKANPNDDSIEAEARSGLLDLIADQPSVTLGLHEATSFRRSEIGALSAQTLLLMGRGQVFFGGDGLLSNPKHHSHWQQYFATLRSMVDRNPDSATQVQVAIAEMQSADLDAIAKLLTGFSNKQLEAGGDAKLVQWLNAEALSVRVMALENLREITGTTLFFRPQDTLKRREMAARKWEARLRKGDIRRESMVK